MRGGKVWLLLNYRTELALGVLVVVALDQRQRQVVSGFPSLGVKLQGGLEGGNCAGEYPLLRIEGTERLVPIGGWVIGEGLQQVEFLCANVDRATEILKEKFKMAPVYPATRPGADGTRVNFFLVASPDGGKVLIELYQAATKVPS